MTTRTSEQAFSTSSNGGRANETMQGTGLSHLPDSLPWWMVWKIRLTKGWDHIVVNKNIDSVTMPKWVASALFVAFLSFAIASWWRQSDQRDLLIKMQTTLDLAEKAQLKKDIDEDQFKKDQQAWRETMNGQLREIKGMLSQQQLNALERLQKSGQTDNQ